MPYRVERQLTLNLPRSAVWKFLTDPELITEWFADCSHLAPGDAFRFDFGDGDYFAGRVAGWEPPNLLHLKWKFCNLGPEFDIVYMLADAGGDATELRVSDTGSLSAEEAEGLSEGWKDFLSRLEQRISSGKPSRYLWSQTIGIAALADRDPEEVWSAITDPAWIAGAFGDAASIEAIEGREMRLHFRRDAWRDKATEATVGVSDVDGKAYVGVVHAGWTDLPEAQQIAERARFLGLWSDALQQLETVAASQV